jgi:hypothetical protein
MSYVAGFNIPGYLPEMEPAHFLNVNEAKTFIIDELERDLDQDPEFLSNEKFAEIKDALEYIKNHPGPRLSVKVGKYIFWIEQGFGPCVYCEKETSEYVEDFDNQGNIADWQYMCPDCQDREIKEMEE